MRPWTWWLRRFVALALAWACASLPGIYAFTVAELLTDSAAGLWAVIPGLVVFGFVFAVVFTLIADGPRQLVALVHRPAHGALRTAPGSR